VKKIILSLIIILVSAFILLAEETEVVVPKLISSDIISGELKADLKKIITIIPVGEEHQYGFTDRKQFDKVELGTVFQILTPIPDLSPVQYLPPEKAWRPNGLLKVAVSINSEYRSLLRVEKKDGKYRGISLGEPELAKELNDLNKKYGFNNFKNPTRIVSIEKIASDFLIIPDDTLSMDDSKIYPLESARKVFGKKIKHKGRLSKVIKAYHPIMIKYIQGVD
jgi:hypothetical protein